jgi:SAM-dependent methyltransferase
MHMSHRAAGTGWWDEGFTRLLARHVPPEARLMLDLGCGLGWAGLSLLPSLPNLRYHGVDDTPLNVEVANRNLQSSGSAARGTVELGDPARLSSIGDSTVDVVLSIMNLERYPDSRPVFAEAARVLRPGGRMIAIEPDGLSQQFWFDGPLPVFNERFRELCERANALVQGNSPVEDPLGQPGIAIGPHLGARLRAAGLQPDIELVHLVQVAQQASFASFARRMRKRVEAMQTAAGMSEGDPALRDTQEAIRRLEHAHLDGLPGSGVHGLPLFLVVGFKA